MHYNIQKIFIFLLIMTYGSISYATDSTTIQPPAVHSMHQTPKVDTKHTVVYQTIDYTSTGDQAVNPCPDNTALVHIQHASRQVYWGPPKSVCSRYGSCSGAGCWCAGSPHSCCAWCSPPCREYSVVKWQTRPTSNQSTAIHENMPSVLSAAGCAPVKNEWERVT